MGDGCREALYLKERAEERHRDLYLDMRNAHRIAMSGVRSTGKDIKRIYKETLITLENEYLSGRREGIRRRDVWESERAV